ncbi:FAD-dependent oxidoreductase [Alkalihalobacillus sp. BA299]|uniref:FAD-dependent oxidoreductase n=1 Tax=Alkalihalobacillus sp. BA299 TaxID=2815938 RepID=UPI001ADCB7AA|nr:FAD-dependent oxidoreductase [Alkalihalobacillus sp. BA299]
MTMNSKNSDHQFPRFPEPYWREQIQFPSFPSLTKNILVDVGIVGAGITGITTAYLLSQAGVKVALIDAGVILNGTTGHTTAKVTAQHGVIYDELIQHFGEEKAKQYYQANDQARVFIKDMVSSLNINCDFIEQDAYIYTNSEQELNKLEKEAKAYEKLGIPGSIVETMPLQIPMKRAVIMDKQAQFHPIKYLLPLVEEIKRAGGLIFENTTAVNVEEEDQPKIITKNGHHVTCKYVVSCSHFPFYDGMGFYFARMHSERSYVVAVKTDQQFPGGMYLSSESPTRSIRSTPFGDDQLLLLGGDGHKTGQGINTMKHYEALVQFGKEVLGLTDIQYRWSAQDLYSLDKVPYVGPITSSKENILVATGYRKWGMTNSTAAAMMLKDLIIEGKHQYQDVFTPSRFKADPSIKEMVAQNVNVAVELVKGKLETLHKYPEDVQVGEGVHVKVDGKKAGAYRDEDGVLHCVDTTCTHMGCEVEWNEGDRSWDCPCHGSRFSIDGDVIEGPADQPLKKLKIDKTS